MNSKKNRIKAEEAEEDHDFINDDDHIPKDQNVKGDELEEYQERDYQKIEALDDYKQESFDEEQYSQIGLDQKRQADEEIERRYKQGQKGRNVPYIKNDEDYESQQRFQQDSKQYDKNNQYYEEDGDHINDDRYQQLEDIRGKLPEWIKDQKTQKYIKKSFYKFLMEFYQDKVFIYQEKIKKTCSENQQSVEVQYKHLSDTNPTIAFWIFESPSIIFGFLNKVLLDVACKFYPGYENIYEEMFVKIENFPLIEKIGELRTFHINTFVKVNGIVTKIFPSRSKLLKIYYVCPKCTDKKGPIYYNEGEAMKLPQCSICQYKGSYEIQDDTVYSTFQKVFVQENQSSLSQGKMPRSKKVILLGDNIDSVVPGDEVEIVGIYQSIFDNKKTLNYSFPIFKTYIEANNIRKLKEIDTSEISEKERERIHQEAKSPTIFRKIYSSIAPSIFGHELIKKTIALAIFGGVPMKRESHSIRGDVNVLLLGDPGLAKSQFLKYVQQVSHRCIYTTGKGASAVGLTAIMKKNDQGEWHLEGGAFVLADQGICLIDEFDKMDDTDRTSIHEAMEQQSISISKAGIVSTLKARCTVIAAANPVKGNYDDKLSFKENVDLSDPILSRFDVLLVLKDEFNVIKDQKLCEFIIDNHINNYNTQLQQQEELIDTEIERIDDNQKFLFEQKFLKKYILYVKKYYNTPKLDVNSAKKLEEFYVQLRQESKKTSGLNIVVRHLESLTRLAQASAKIHLRKTTNERDCDVAIEILLNSFIQTQKPSIGLNLQKKFQEYLKRRTSFEQKLTVLLNEIMNQQIMFDTLKKSDIEQCQQVKIKLDEFEKRARENEIYDLTKFLQSDYFLSNFSLIKEMWQNKEIQYILKEI